MIGGKPTVEILGSRGRSAGHLGNSARRRLGGEGLPCDEKQHKMGRIVPGSFAFDYPAIHGFSRLYVKGRSHPTKLGEAY